MRRFLFFIILCLVVAGSASAAEKMTYIDLIKRLTNIESLAVLPAQGETCSQWSSWDRTSQYDAKTGKYINWDANGDGRGIIRKEGDQQVFAEMTGPGCIWRTWSAAPEAGHVKIYLDGSSTPVVDLPFSGYFDLKNAPFVYPSLVHNAASGKNCYIPIPYQKSCKIVADKDWGSYYQFDYVTYPKGTILPTFKRELSDAEIKALKNADEILSKKLGNDPAGKRKGEETLTSRVMIRGGKKTVIASLKGNRAITCIKIKTKAVDENILREAMLRIYWDGEKEPSVCVPLIDFFGTAPTINKYKSLPMGITDNGFYSFWYMPFAKSAVVEIVNESNHLFTAVWSITHAPLTRSVKDMGRFHAKWHLDAFLPTEPERWLDWTILKTQGKGRFCGVALHVWNPKGGWWGEGDEKFFVDGEKMPSFFGTGSEDYFGYAWCNPKLFENAYHNQPRSDNNSGHTSVNRWHITDNVPFQKTFDGYIEKYYENNRPTQYACTAYWYLAPGGVDPYKSVPVKERLSYRITPTIYDVPGAIEAEKLKVANKYNGFIDSQNMQSFGDGKWSNGNQLFWSECKVSDELILTLPVKDTKKYNLKVNLTKANDYGICQFFVDGQKAGDSIDLFNSEVALTGEMSLGDFDLTSGDHQLSVKIVGANSLSYKSHFGIDYIKLIPTK